MVKVSSRTLTLHTCVMVHMISHVQLLGLRLNLTCLFLHPSCWCADYEVRVAVHSYRNPSHLHAGGGCCDLTVVFFLFFPIVRCGDCDNYFLFCLRTPGATRDCPLGELHSGEVGGDSLTFNPGVGGSFGRLSNPLHFTNTGNWTVSVGYICAHRMCCLIR